MIKRLVFSLCVTSLVADVQPLYAHKRRAIIEGDLYQRSIIPRFIRQNQIARRKMEKIENSQVSLQKRQVIRQRSLLEIRRTIRQRSLLETRRAIRQRSLLEMRRAIRQRSLLEMRRAIRQRSLLEMRRAIRQRSLLERRRVIRQRSLLEIRRVIRQRSLLETRRAIRQRNLLERRRAIRQKILEKELAIRTRRNKSIIPVRINSQVQKRSPLLQLREENRIPFHPVVRAKAHLEGNMREGGVTLAPVQLSPQHLEPRQTVLQEARNEGLFQEETMLESPALLLVGRHGEAPYQQETTERESEEVETRAHVERREVPLQQQREEEPHQDEQHHLARHHQMEQEQKEKESFNWIKDEEEFIRIHIYVKAILDSISEAKDLQKQQQSHQLENEPEEDIYKPWKNNIKGMKRVRDKAKSKKLYDLFQAKVQLHGILYALGFVPEENQTLQLLEFGLDIQTRLNEINALIAQEDCTNQDELEMSTKIRIPRIGDSYRLAFDLPDNGRPFSPLKANLLPVKAPNEPRFNTALQPSLKENPGSQAVLHSSFGNQHKTAVSTTPRISASYRLASRSPSNPIKMPTPQINVSSETKMTADFKPATLELGMQQSTPLIPSTLGENPSQKVVLYQARRSQEEFPLEYFTGIDHNTHQGICLEGFNFHVSSMTPESASYLPVGKTAHFSGYIGGLDTHASNCPRFSELDGVSEKSDQPKQRTIRMVFAQEAISSTFTTNTLAKLKNKKQESNIHYINLIELLSHYGSSQKNLYLNFQNIIKEILGETIQTVANSSVKIIFDLENLIHSEAVKIRQFINTYLLIPGVKIKIKGGLPSKHMDTNLSESTEEAFDLLGKSDILRLDDPDTSLPFTVNTSKSPSSVSSRIHRLPGKSVSKLNVSPEPPPCLIAPISLTPTVVDASTFLPPKRATPPSTSTLVDASKTLPPKKPTVSSTPPTLVDASKTLPPKKPTVSSTPPTFVDASKTLPPKKPTVSSTPPTFVDASKTLPPKKPTVSSTPPTVVDRRTTLSSSKGSALRDASNSISLKSGVDSSKNQTTRSSRKNKENNNPSSDF
jgi:hypothetical protein